MKNKHLHLSFDWANLVDAWALFLLMLVPLAFNFLEVTSLDLLKAVLFQGGAIIFCLLVTGQLIFTKFKPRFGKSLFPLIFFIFFLISALVFSVDPVQSWWGSYARHLGVFTYLIGLLGILALLLSFSLSSEIERKKRRQFYFFGIVITACLLSIYALLQLVGFDIVRWAEPASQTGRAFASLGQPTYLAGLLLLTIPVTATLRLNVSPKRRYLLLFPLILQLLGLLATGTRSAFLVLGVTLLIFLFFKFFQSFQKLDRKLFKKVVLVFLFISLLFSLLAISNPSRWQELGDIRSGSLGLRVELWREGLIAIKEKPWFGYGLENQSEAYIYQYDTKMMRYLRPDVSTDRAHNLVLDSILTSGIIGFLFIIFFLISLIKYYYHLSQSQRSFAYELLFSGCAYFLFLLFNFSVVSTFFYSSLLLGIFLSLGLPPAQEQVKHSLLKFLPLLILVPLIGGLVFFSGARLRADYFYHVALSSLNQKDYFKALTLDSYVQEEKTDPISARHYRQNFTWALIDHLILYNLPLADRKVSLERINDNPDKENFLTFNNRLFSAAVLGFKGELEGAQAELNELLLLVPSLPRIYLVLGDLNCYNENLGAADKNWQLASDLVPIFEPNWGEDQRQRLAQYQNMLKARQGRLVEKE